ncbi:MAG: helix-turn-helix domain-containing protein, partial [Planctomycetaceae bacterium]
NASGNPGTRPGASGGAAASEAELAERVREVVEAWAHAVEMSGEGTLTPALYERMLALVEPPLLQVALERAGQNRAAAAALLGLHRGTLRQKLRDHGIESGSGRGVGDD